MAELIYRWLEPEEVSRVGEIDRAEKITTGYKILDGTLTAMEVNWNITSWVSDTKSGHSVAAQIDFCTNHLRNNGRMYGAFDGGRLAGIGLVRHRLREGIAQLAYLHVSRTYRRQGIGVRLLTELFQAARTAGEQQMVVSAAPTLSAMSFYLKHGFVLMDEPIPELYEREPEDIHMVKCLVCL